MELLPKELINIILRTYYTPKIDWFEEYNEFFIQINSPIIEIQIQLPIHRHTTDIKNFIECLEQNYNQCKMNIKGYYFNFFMLMNEDEIHIHNYNLKNDQKSNNILKNTEE